MDIAKQYVRQFMYENRKLLTEKFDNAAGHRLPSNDDEDYVVKIIAGRGPTLVTASEKVFGMKILALNLYNSLKNSRDECYTHIKDKKSTPSPEDIAAVILECTKGSEYTDVRIKIFSEYKDQIKRYYGEIVKFDD